MTRLFVSLGAGVALALAAGAAQAQAPAHEHGGTPPSAGMPMMNPEQMHSMMQRMHRGGMGSGMMGSGMMRGGMMGHDAMMRIMFAVADENGDGTLSLEEMQTMHARIFRAADADGDGSLTLEEIRSFMTGNPAAAAGGAQ